MAINFDRFQAMDSTAIHDEIERWCSQHNLAQQAVDAFFDNGGQAANPLANVLQRRVNEAIQKIEVPCRFLKQSRGHDDFMEALRILRLRNVTIVGLNNDGGEG